MPNWRTPRCWFTNPPRLAACALLAASTWLTSGCASRLEPPTEPAFESQLRRLLPADALLLGEQHDAPEHQALELRAVRYLIRERQLAALALEMAEAGNGTAHLPAAADEATVRKALGWNDRAWSWNAYGPAVMTAVRAGVPVLGANLPRDRQRAAMADVSLDAQLDPEALAAQRRAVRDGHCGLLPERQIVPMTRIQIARDRAMAQTVIDALSHGKTVLLVSGAAHGTRQLGVPQHLPSHLRTRTVQLVAGAEAEPVPEFAGPDLRWPTAALAPQDYCATLRRSS